MRILHVVHDFLPRHRAGTEIYVAELGRRLRDRGHEIHVLCAEYDPRRPHGSVAWRWYQRLPVTEIVNNWCFDSFEETYRSPRLRRVLGHALDAIAPDVVHVHNLLNLTLDLPELAARRGIPCVATLHDYTLDCPSGGQRFHAAEDHVCCDVDPARCAICIPESTQHAQMALARLARRTTGVRLAGRLARAVLRHRPRLFERLRRSRTAQPLSAADVERRLAYVRERVVPHVELFVAPSAALADAFRRSCGPAEDKVLVSDHGAVPWSPAPREPRAGQKLRIGFVGTLARTKGVHVLLEAARRLPPERYELRIHGATETSPAYAEELRRAARGLPVTFHGAFDRDHVAAVYARLDVLAVPSLWPENSPLVVHEAFLAGVPVVASRIGGLAHLVGDGRLLHRPGSAEELAAILRRFVEDPGMLEEVASSLPDVKTVDEDAEAWEERYGSVLRGRTAAATGSRSRLAVVIVNHRTPWDVVLAVRSLGSSCPDTVLVVENGSDDDSVEVLERELPDGARLIRSAVNLGFPGGCNLGLREALAAGAERILLLNSDALLTPDTLRRLEAVLEDPAVGLVGPVVLRSDDPGRIDSAGISFSPRSGRMRLLAHGRAFEPRRDRRVDGVAGCAMLLRRQVLERTGLLDEAYFFGFEDLDLCLRAGQEGYRTVVAGRAVLYHHRGRSLADRSPRRLYFATRNHLRLARLRSPRGLPSGMLRAFWVVVLGLASALRRESPWRGLREVIRGTRDHLRRRYGPAPA